MQMVQQLIRPYEPLMDEIADTEEGVAPQPSRADLIARIREELPQHLATLGIDPTAPTLSKDLIRLYHSAQKADYFSQESAFITKYGRSLLAHFADGTEVDPARVDPYLVHVLPNSEESALFRLATLLWSIPVSRGYGRRLRFLVRDHANEKLIGIFGLTDPVFNLKSRDIWIGWEVAARKQRLVNLMDAHVLGAVPPYSTLLGGKLVASLMTSQEVCAIFQQRYGSRTGIISNEQKAAQLLLITVTSALGRSSLYDRLKLPGVFNFTRIGATMGWGHFHIPQTLFQAMRTLLQQQEDPYASGYRFGQGPNWRLRVIRKGLALAGLDRNLLKHGIQREVYGVPLAEGWREYLMGNSSALPTPQRPSVAEISELVKERWLLPRAARRPDYQEWTREQTWSLLMNEN